MKTSVGDGSDAGVAEEDDSVGEGKRRRTTVPKQPRERTMHWLDQMTIKCMFKGGSILTPLFQVNFLLKKWKDAGVNEDEVKMMQLRVNQVGFVDQFLKQCLTMPTDDLTEVYEKFASQIDDEDYSNSTLCALIERGWRQALEKVKMEDSDELFNEARTAATAIIEPWLLQSQVRPDRILPLKLTNRNSPMLFDDRFELYKRLMFTQFLNRHVFVVPHNGQTSSGQKLSVFFWFNPDSNRAKIKTIRSFVVWCSNE